MGACLLLHITFEGGQQHYMLISLSAWGLNFILCMVRLVYRNIGGRPLSNEWRVDRVHINEFVDPKDDVITAALLTMAVRRPWSFSAGQFVYLCLPTISTFSMLQSHPFSIVWWETSPSGEATISFLVEPTGSFTSNLVRLRSARLEIIDGPYGQEHEFGNYETVLMFAGGMGIAGVLPYIRRLVEGESRKKLRVRRLSVIWVLERECE